MAVDNIGEHRFSFDDLEIPYDGNIDLNASNSGVEMAVVAVHGTNRDSDGTAAGVP